jgi:magnesium chelatase family protein
MFACISSAILHGVQGTPVEVEVHVAQSALPGFNIVGLPDAAVRESRDRVRAALVTSGLKWPNRKVTVNLAPSGVKKGGVWLDLPIAIGVAVASDQLEPERVEGFAFVGELGLDGSLRSVLGVVPLAASLSARRIVAPGSLEETVRMSPEAAALLERRLRSGVLSARGFHRVRRVARTIADLDRVGAVVGELQVAEALSLRDARRTLLVDGDQ